jgi:hypothetical protein
MILGAGVAIADAFCAAGASYLILTDTNIEREKKAHQMVSMYWAGFEMGQAQVHPQLGFLELT